MPTYEYRCPKGHEFEVFQRITAEPGAPCPTCGEPAERQLSAGAGLLFKGSGFYITDYRSDSYKKAAGGDKSGDGDKSGGDKSGGDKSGGAKSGGAKSGGTDAKPKDSGASPSSSSSSKSGD